MDAELFVSYTCAPTQKLDKIISEDKKKGGLRGAPIPPPGVFLKGALVFSFVKLYFF